MSSPSQAMRLRAWVCLESLFHSGPRMFDQVELGRARQVHLPDVRLGNKLTHFGGAMRGRVVHQEGSIQLHPLAFPAFRAGAYAVLFRL